MLDTLTLFFELTPTGSFESLPFLMGIATLVLIASIIFLIVLRVQRPEKELCVFLNSIPMLLFYFSLSGYFLVIFRLSKTPFLGARFMWAIWIAAFALVAFLTSKKYTQVKKLVARKKANRETGVEVVDPYLSAHFAKKKR